MSIKISVAAKSKKPYVYSLAYPDGRVFYIGKGTGYRVNEHEQEARKELKEYNPYKCRVIRKIWAAGEQVQKTILACFDTDEQAHAYEIALIFFLPGLTNLTSGGEGVHGYTQTPEQIEKHRRCNLGRKQTPEAIEKNRQAQMGNTRRLGKKNTPEAIEKVRQAQMGNTHALGYRHTPETIERIRQNNQGQKRKSETIERIRQDKLGKNARQNIRQTVVKPA